MRYLLLVSFLFIAGCTDIPNTERALRNAGFTDIKAGDYAPFACAEDDLFHTAFTARNPAGQMSSGVVCCDAFKGCTIRY